jgi:hypothetical protein
MPEATTTVPRRPHLLVRGASATLALLGVGTYLALNHLVDAPREPHCTVTSEDGSRRYTLEPEQAANAATIEAVGSARGLPERAVTIAIATAMQESSLRNLDYGDRDSLGLFQQRPSMGWGTPEEVQDPVYAAGAFYERLVEVPGYLTLPLTVAAQEVQRSAFPDEYAKHEANASLLAAALTGRAPAALTCTPGDPPVTGDPDVVLARMVREFGEGVTPGGAGQELTVPVPADAEPRRGWELAHWSVAHAAELGIERVTFGDRVWESRRAGEGWREISGGGAGSSGAEVQLSLSAVE